LTDVSQNFNAILGLSYAKEFGTPILEKGDRKGSAMVPFKRAMVLSYGLSILTIALSQFLMMPDA